MTGTPATVVASYRERTRFAAAEVRAVEPPRLLSGLLREATHVAELPCGAGHFLPDYADRGLAVTLVDGCAEMLALAAERAAERGLPAHRVTARRALVQELAPLREVDLVVMPNAALNQLAAQSPLPTVLAAVRAAVRPGTMVLAQVCCAQPNGTVDASSFYDDRRPHGQWFSDTVLRDKRVEVLRWRRQRREQSRLRIDFEYRGPAATVLRAAEVELELFTADELISVFRSVGFTDVRLLRGKGGLSELTAIAGTGATR